MKPIATSVLDPRPDAARVAAVFVTYHPDAGLYDRVLAVAGQVGAILIVDNGSTAQELARVRQLAAEGVAEAIMNGENRGQAAALNQGLAWGSARGFPWIVTFDQDTLASPMLLAESGRVFDAHCLRPVAVIGAGWASTRRYPSGCTEPGGVEVESVITSGSLHSVAIWDSLGGFREDFFIDYVDIEYCLRARSAGYVVARSCVPTMDHAIGNPTRRRLLLRVVQPSNHSAFRRYFITRNRLHIWRAYLRTEPRYVLSDMKASAKELIKLLLFETDRGPKLTAIARGLRDAVLGITGPITTPTPRDGTLRNP